MKRLSLILLLATSVHAQPYVRAALGYDRSSDTHLRDRDCSSTEPPALFGCDAGMDGRALGAYGDFGSTVTGEVAIGRQAGRVRYELSLLHRDLDLEAEANFLRVEGAQPVRAQGRSVAAMLGGALDLGPVSWRVQPFVHAAAGVARNSTGEVVYSFPGIAAEAVTITPGGASTSFAWSAGLGASVALSPSFSLELTLRHTDLGALRSPAGTATIVRPGRSLEIEIDETRADVQMRGVAVGGRWRW